MKRFAKHLFGHLWRELFPNPVARIDTTIRLLGYLGLFVGLTRIVRDMSRAWPGQQEFALYLFLSYFVSIFGLALLLLLARQIWHHLYEANDLRGVAVSTQHKLAEVVRLYALNHGTADQKLLQENVGLHGVLDGVLVFLQKKLNRTDIVIAVKYINGEAGARTIDAVIRHPEPDGTSQRMNSMRAEDSVVYTHFIEGNRQIQRVIVEDVNQLDTEPVAGFVQSERNLKYQGYAKKCKFRSVLAFPLRQPKAADGGDLAVSGILGYLSFDCPDAYGFDGLFTKTAASVTNDGRHLKDTPDLQFFFGLADSLATLAILGAK